MNGQDKFAADLGEHHFPYSHRPVVRVVSTVNHQQGPPYTSSSAFFRLHFNLIPFTPRITTTHQSNSLSPFNSPTITYFILPSHPFLTLFHLYLSFFSSRSTIFEFRPRLVPSPISPQISFLSSSFSIITKREVTFILTHASLVEYPRFVLSFEVSIYLVPPYRVCRLMPLILASLSRS